MCIARALINQPQIILADEPTGNLDKNNEEAVLDIFRELHSEVKNIAPFGGPFLVIVAGEEKSLGKELTEKILVQKSGVI